MRCQSDAAHIRRLNLRLKTEGRAKPRAAGDANVEQRVFSIICVHLVRRRDAEIILPALTLVSD